MNDLYYKLYIYVSVAKTTKTNNFRKTLLESYRVVHESDCLSKKSFFFQPLF